MVCSINTQQLIGKADGDGSPPELGDMLMQKNEQVQRVMEAIAENPLGTGVDFLERIFFFMNSDEARELQYGCFALQLVSGHEFGIFITEALELPTVQQEGYEYIALDEHTIVGWNSDVALLLHTEQHTKDNNKEHYLEQLMDEQQERFVQNEQFKQFVTGNYDMGWYYNWEYVRASLPSLMRSFTDEYLAIFEDNYSQALLTFETGKINIEVQSHLTEHVKGDYHVLRHEGIDAQLQFPAVAAQSMAHYSLAMNHETIYKIIKEGNEKGGVLTMLTQQYHFTEEVINDVFTGDMVVFFMGFEATDLTYDTTANRWAYTDSLPGAVTDSTRISPVTLTVLGIKAQQQLQALLDTAGCIKKEGYWYTADASFVVSNHQLMVTSDPRLAQQIAQQPQYTPLPQQRHGVMTQHPVAGFMAMQLNQYPADWQERFAAGMGNEAYQQTAAFLQPFDRMTIQGNLHDGIEVVLHCTDSTANSLNVLGSGAKTITP